MDKPVHGEEASETICSAALIYCKEKKKLLYEKNSSKWMKFPGQILNEETLLLLVLIYLLGTGACSHVGVLHLLYNNVVKCIPFFKIYMKYIKETIDKTA